MVNTVNPDLLGTRSRLLNAAARFAYSARALGLAAAVRRLGSSYQARRAERKTNPIHCAPTVPELKQCSWLADCHELQVSELHLSNEHLAEFMRRTRYPRFYYFSRRRIRYAAWHEIGLRLAELTPRDVVLDVGAQAGIWGTIARRTAGCRVLDLDLAYPPGRHEDRIGADAAKIPLPDGAINCMASFCAFNCFEGSADIDLLRAANRLLATGGRIVIVPFCVGDAHVNLFDPDLCSYPEAFDEEAMRIAWPGWGNNFGRWYDRHAFQSRLLPQLTRFTLEVFAVHHDCSDVDLASPFHAARFTLTSP